MCLNFFVYLGDPASYSVSMSYGYVGCGAGQEARGSGSGRQVVAQGQPVLGSSS